MEKQVRIPVPSTQASITDLVYDFTRGILATGNRRFYGAQLRHYVATRLQTAPASPDRILRQLRKLRKQGAINYRVVNGAASLYEVVA